MPRSRVRKAALVLKAMPVTKRTSTGTRGRYGVLARQVRTAATSAVIMELRNGTISTPPAVPTGTPTVSMSFQANMMPRRRIRSESRVGTKPAIAESGTASSVPNTR
jgi:hypothetical protein